MPDVNSPPIDGVALAAVVDLFGDEQIGRAQLPERRQRRRERVLDAAAPAAVVDHRDLERVRAGARR